jgi:hypothetical protein
VTQRSAWVARKIPTDRKSEIDKKHASLGTVAAGVLFIVTHIRTACKDFLSDWKKIMNNARENKPTRRSNWGLSKRTRQGELLQKFPLEPLKTFGKSFEFAKKQCSPTEVK